jgi:hypothetical protein
MISTQLYNIFLSNDITGYRDFTNSDLEQDTLEGIFYLNKMRCIDLSVEERLSARDILAQKGIVNKEDYPITLMEQLQTSAVSLPAVRLKDSIARFDTIYYIVEDEPERNKWFISVLKEIDTKSMAPSSSVVKYEIHVLRDKRSICKIKIFLKDDSVLVEKESNVGYRYIYKR